MRNRISKYSFGRQEIPPDHKNDAPQQDLPGSLIEDCTQAGMSIMVATENLERLKRRISTCPDEDTVFDEILSELRNATLSVSRVRHSIRGEG